MNSGALFGLGLFGLGILTALAGVTAGSMMTEKQTQKQMILPIPSKSQMDYWSDKVIFITGGTSGIGLATAAAFAVHLPRQIIVCGRTAEKWKKAQQFLKSKLSKNELQRIEYWPCDVRVEKQVADIVSKIFDKYKRLDVAFNNAGVMPGTNGDITQLEFISNLESNGTLNFSLGVPPCPASQVSPVSQSCESPIATSIFGVFYCMKWEIKYAFSKNPPGVGLAIINTASRNGILPDPNRPLYAASKSFIISLTRSLSNQIAQRCISEKKTMIRINAVAPGPVDTPSERGAFGNTNDAEFITKATVGVPMQRVASPEEIATSVVFLANNKLSSYTTGAILAVDGGDTASPFFKK